MKERRQGMLTITPGDTIVTYADGIQEILEPQDIQVLLVAGDQGLEYSQLVDIRDLISAFIAQETMKGAKDTVEPIEESLEIPNFLKRQAD